MINAILTMAIMAVFYAGFTALFRNKRCAGNCGSCQGSCHAAGGDHDED
ncbi:MAG TPA: hypothetical protein VKP00_17140 [Gemmatimonadaceae bacterium]|jgi:hypothetical protein|nr:hypothetical protein [Gemmatimonadaceae bacterium]